MRVVAVALRPQLTADEALEEANIVHELAEKSRLDEHVHLSLQKHG